ncbi:hypothetical protein, partial [Staphylococcus hominis]|uniref:hypothetical protein n=1 Tax=Staphylococcus hominis TaxID=1290 RepID=UPI001C930F18
QILHKEYLNNQLTNSTLHVTLNHLHNYLNQYNKTIQPKNRKKPKENLVPFKKQLQKQQKNTTTTTNTHPSHPITLTPFAHTTPT